MKTIQLSTADILFLIDLTDVERASAASDEPRRADRLYRLFQRTENITLALDDACMSEARSSGTPDGRRLAR